MLNLSVLSILPVRRTIIPILLDPHNQTSISYACRKFDDCLPTATWLGVTMAHSLTFSFWVPTMDSSFSAALRLIFHLETGQVWMSRWVTLVSCNSDKAKCWGHLTEVSSVGWRWNLLSLGSRPHFVSSPQSQWSLIKDNSVSGASRVVLLEDA